MSQIDSKLVMELRSRTGVGIGKCKEALVLAEGNIENAIDILRKKGMASAVKKEGRETKEGLIGVAQNDSHVALIEINAETDFVVKNDEFKKFVNDLALQLLNSKEENLEKFLKEKSESDKSVDIEGYRNLLVQKIGENIQIRRIEIIHKENASYGVYSHMGGQIVVVDEVLGDVKDKTIPKSLAMHIAAESPEFISEKDIPLDVKKREEEVYRSQLEGKKPDNIIDKILVGKMKSFYEKSCLYDQKYIKEDKLTVEEFLKKNGNLQVQRMWRWKVGQ